MIFSSRPTRRLRLGSSRRGCCADGKVTVLIENYEPVEYMNSPRQVSSLSDLKSKFDTDFQVRQPAE